MAILTALGAWWSLRAFERQVEERMKQDLELVARAIELPLNDALLRDRQGAVAKALRSAFDLSPVYAAYLYDAEGRRITESAPDETQSETRLRDVPEAVPEGERHGEYGRVDGQRVYSYFVPMTDAGGRMNGLLQLTRPRSDFHNQILRIRIKAFAMYLSAFLGLTGIVLYGHHRVLGLHLHAFTDSMSRIALGERHHRHPPSGPRELALLGQHFNRMLDEIDAAETEIAQRRQEQIRLADRLRHAEKLAAVGELAAGVAHELGTPLSVIDARSQRALRQKDLHDTDRERWQGIRREAERMQGIIRQLLDFSRAHQAAFRTVSARSIAQAATEALSTPDTPSPPEFVLEGEDFEVAADPLRIEQALVNLLRNALQAAPGKPVTLRWRQEGEHVLFEVEDQGPGIPEAIRDKLFEPFFTTKAVGQGTGLGLAVVHGIAGEHGGNIALVPTQQGALFRLKFPANPPNRRPS